MRVNMPTVKDNDGHRVPMPSFVRAETPWGLADFITVVAPGIVFVTTPSHGGYILDDERNAKVLERFPFEPGEKTMTPPTFYEEDCEWAFVCATFPELFPRRAHDAAEATLLRTYGCRVVIRPPNTQGYGAGDQRR